MVSGWCARNINYKQYLQIKFPSVTKISGLATQGRGNANQYVKKYFISYSKDGTSFVIYKDSGKVKVSSHTNTHSYLFHW